MVTITKEKNGVLQQRVDSLAREVGRLRAIVDWEKALENAPYDEGEIRPEFARRLIRNMNRIRAGIEPVYHYDPETFRSRLENARKSRWHTKAR